jgi:hypothetical protein
MAGVAIASFFVSTGPAIPVDEPASSRSIYHADPSHLWNRLHEALFVRIGPDKRAYGHDRLEPLLWSYSKHLLEERSHQRALGLLEEFLKGKGESLVEDPLKRALLQRDLWLVFNWLEGNHNHFAEPGLKAETARAAQERLRRPLAAVIGRLALRPDQIEKLPDNYSLAVESGKFAKHHDAEQPDRPYLPTDLFAADGPWVCVGRPDGLVAPSHLREDQTNRFTNSAFLVFLRVPKGRDATLAYLKRLRDFDQPPLVKEGARPPDKFFPNPDVPPLPVGTELALVRRALLIDSSRTIVPTSLTESVQLRVYREVPKMTPETLAAALGGGTSPNWRDARSWQSSYEFRLSRSLLVAGRAGGLRAVDPDERDFKTGFGAHPNDEFESAGRPFPEVRQERIVHTCFFCHSLPGVHSFNTYFNYRISNMRDGDKGRPASLNAVSLDEALAANVKWKKSRPNWNVLRKLLKE